MEEHGYFSDVMKKVSNNFMGGMYDYSSIYKMMLKIQYTIIFMATHGVIVLLFMKLGRSFLKTLNLEKSRFGHSFNTFCSIISTFLNMRFLFTSLI